MMIGDVLERGKKKDKIRKFFKTTYKMYKHQRVSPFVTPQNFQHS